MLLNMTIRLVLWIINVLTVLVPTLLGLVRAPSSCERERMDCLECKICNIMYDEDDHRPRNASCGHDLCTVCMRTIIQNNLFKCPTCRQITIVDGPENLPVIFGLIDVIRAFKTQINPLTKESETKISVASNEVCTVHHKAIEHRCLKCKLWICEECLDFHSTLMGCSTVSSYNAMNSMKVKQSEDVQNLLMNFKDDANNVSSNIKEYGDKKNELLERAEKYGEEVEKLHKLLEQGNIHKDKLVESENHLKATNLPSAMMEKIEMLTQRKQLLRCWSIENIAQGNIHKEMLVESENHLNTTTSPDTPKSLLKALKEGKVVYAEMVINNENRHAKLSHHGRNIYYHFFQTQTVADTSTCMPFDQLQNMIPEEPSLVFLELSLDDVVKGRVLVRLDKDLPNIRSNIVHIVTGQCGPCLAETTFNACDGNAIRAYSLPFSEIPVTIDSNGITRGKRGDVIGYFSCGYLYSLCFFVAMPPKIYDYGRKHRVLGHIEDGLDVIQDCYDNYTHGSSNVKITDCGLVIEQN